MPGVLEPAQPPLPLPDGLVRVLRPIVQPAVLPVLDAREHHPLGSAP